MEYITTTLGNLVHQTAFFSLTWGNVVMIAVACFFLYLAIRHGFEPLLLVPIASDGDHGTNCSGGLFLYVTGADYSATDYEITYNGERT